ncbi:MAG: hypothetical protein WCG93_00730 [Paludibacter sp.]
MKKNSRFSILKTVSFVIAVLVFAACTSTKLAPVLTTTAVTEIASGTATSGGNISSDGGASITERGVCWNTAANPTINNSKTSNSSGSGIFTSSLTGLKASTTYHVRAYATNSEGTSYGEEFTFTTLQATAPVLTTSATTNIAATTATSGGNITSDGGSTLTAKGVCWSTTTNPTITNSKTSEGTTIGTYISSVTGLTATTTYYLRAYATNLIGTTYGNEITMTTTAVPPKTAGTFTISTATSTAGGNYAPNHVLAFWIENNSGVFVKSLLVFAAARKADLTYWIYNSTGNTTNATTGATQSIYATRTCSWNGTNVSGAIVEDGTYRICMELTDRNGTGNFSYFNFTKGAVAQTQAPANVSSFSNISLKWTPN